MIFEEVRRVFGIVGVDGVIDLVSIGRKFGVWGDRRKLFIEELDGGNSLGKIFYF